MPVINLARQCFSSERRNVAYPVVSAQGSTPHPYVLDFLDLPDQAQLRESDLETAIIENLQPFLLELGKGFAFVARQYRVATESQHFFIEKRQEKHRIHQFFSSPARVGFALLDQQ
jgi:predicted nuclease of restriction endonuclease-like (RecB) superfamily